MILCDSSVWIDYLRGVITPQTERLHQALGSEPVAIGDLILMEVLQGIRDEDQFRTVLALLSSLVIVNMAGQEIAIQAAQNYRRLRAVGVTVRKTVDTIIATFCIHSFTLLHTDRDFNAFAKHLSLRIA